ncbi:NAD(P)-binding domain-containing protein [Aciduricibacillus chroicocephali]|uniref:NAD(P)-binding domain-containing protein n=1 Tax=Aciduricibacillus chroicocephali TaxID=3054939 RepID=A0ABY9KTV9_9BACI|nr:NAD(P)-binding domain-containing protein [Bacillaceae bacterium 44XB]
MNFELEYLKKSNSRTAIAISTTASHAAPFLLLPRRQADGVALSSFMINNETLLKGILTFFDGEVDSILIDVEPKQKIRLMPIAEKTVRKSHLVAMKPNDVTLESCALLIHHYLGENLEEFRFLILGTGNLAGKTALRLAENGAAVYIAGRSPEKVEKLLGGLNLMLPAHANEIQACREETGTMDAVISFISGIWENEELLESVIESDTLLIDGGIGNFSSHFLEKMLAQNVRMTRLDTRIALPHQLLGMHVYPKDFFEKIHGTEFIEGIPVAAGGFVGPYGTVIVDRIQEPQQVIGIADGKGGVIRDGAIETRGQHAVDKVKKAISIIY